MSQKAFVVHTPGHRYAVPMFGDSSQNHILQFIHKEPNPDNPEQLDLVSDGITNEAVLNVLIDRMKFLQEKFPCIENARALAHMEYSLMWLERRTADRQKRNVEGKHLL